MADATRFEVELKGLQLPDDVIRHIATQIRQTAMREIAALDLRGDINYRLPERIVGPGGHTEGIWADFRGAKLVVTPRGGKVAVTPAAKPATAGRSR